MSNLPELGRLINEMHAEPFPSTSSSARSKSTDSSFADTLAHCATPLFSPWPLVVPPRNETAHTSNPDIAARPTDQRRDRRKRSR